MHQFGWRWNTTDATTAFPVVSEVVWDGKVFLHGDGYSARMMATPQTAAEKEKFLMEMEEFVIMKKVTVNFWACLECRDR